MKLLTLNEISKMDESELTAVLFYWKDGYDPISVLRAYAELKKRNYGIPEKVLKRQNEFCAKHNYNNIDNFLNAHLKENGYNSYEEFLDKGMPQQNKIAENVSKDINHANSYDKYPALRTISGIYKGFAWITGIVTIIIAVMFLKFGEYGIIYSLTSIVLGGLIVLGMLAFGESIMVFIDIEHNTRRKQNEKI